MLKRVFGVGRNAIGFAGMKDKIAVTRQTVSIHLLHDPPSLDLGHDRIQVLWAMRHRNKIKRGHLSGNRFVIRIRNVDPLKVITVRRQLRSLEKTGVPAYFGLQRFGYRKNSHVLGAMVLAGDHQGILDELLGSHGSPFPEHQLERRELYDQGRFEEARRHWTAGDHAESKTLDALIAGRSASKAVQGIGATQLDFWVHATQSAIFNRVVDARLDAGTLEKLFEGDLAWKHDSRAVFPVTPDEMSGDELNRRLAGFEISPSGPLWGWKMTRAASDTDRLEREALNSFGWNLDALLNRQSAPQGGRRPLRVRVSNADVDGGTDEHGGFIRLSFDLPRGAYATVVLREIMRVSEEALRGVRPSEQPMSS